MTWRECKLVPRKVDFKVPKVDCVEGEAIPYTDCVEAEKTQMTTKMTCEVKHTTDCRPVTSTKCQNIRYQVRYPVVYRHSEGGGEETGKLGALNRKDP